MQYRTINNLTVEAGTFFAQFDVDHALPVAVLGSTTVGDLGLSPLRAVGQTINAGGVRFQVVGVLASQGGLIGGVVGLAAGFAGAFAGGSALGVTPVFSWTAVILAIVVAIVVGVLAGIGPAAQAASVEPTNALRYE